VKYKILKTNALIHHSLASSSPRIEVEQEQSYDELGKSAESKGWKMLVIWSKPD